MEPLGPERVTLQGAPLSGSENFAFTQAPGSRVLIGDDGEAGTTSCMVHNPGYDFNDDNVAVGSAFWVLLPLAERFLAVRRNA